MRVCLFIFSAFEIPGNSTASQRHTDGKQRKDVYLIVYLIEAKLTFKKLRPDFRQEISGLTEREDKKRHII